MSDKDLIEHQGTASTSLTAATLSSCSLSSLTPVVPGQRINALDILRGFALMGILLMNIEWFGRPIGGPEGFDVELSGLDHAVGWLIRCFVEGKFYKLFALLFGMGFAVMLTQAMRKERPFGGWFTRRMLVLFVFGILHMLLVWQGDILHVYAFAGLLMLGLIYLLHKKRFERFNNPSSILMLALWWLSIPMLLGSLAGVGYGVFFDRQSQSEQWQQNQEIRAFVLQLETEAAETKKLTSTAQDEYSNNTLEILTDDALNTEQAQIEPVAVEEECDESQDIAQTPLEQAQEIFEAEQKQAQDAADEIVALRDGNFWQATVFRTKASMMWLLFSPVLALTMLLPIFLLGYWLVITGVIKDHSQHPKLFGYMARIGLGVGLFVTVGGLVVMGHPALEHIMPIQVVANVLFHGGQIFMAAGYLGLVIRLLDSPKWHKRLEKLAPMGRMALTNYIMHSLILTSIFYGYAAGLYGEISRAPQVLIVLAIVMVQIPLSSCWLQYFQFGPLEWLWRSLTYKKWQSFRVVPS